jgi:glucose dehydrogenase
MPSSATARSRRSTRNVKDLGLAWSFDTGLPRGHEATPIVVDGVIYTDRLVERVFALDARTGKLVAPRSAWCRARRAPTRAATS